ncbi:MAG: LLM class flavin-dependent oxidoreductase [Acidimicrobiia bacterium]|nr:LLM class flavin-dependent oxidoreductase [Acidimicrobiia bacterium]
MKFGLLLPHFGAHTDLDFMLRGSELAEEVGFDSVWVRDHLLFEPHGEFEASDRDFLEPLTVLSAVGAVTERMILGTATLIPYRHPIITAFTLASMSRMFGDRIIAGWGAGTFDHEFDAVGMGGIFRPELVEENARISELVFNEDDVAYEGPHYQFDSVNVYPKPTGKIPFWYGGATPASARRAAEYADGWIPGRITLKTIEKRVAQMRDLVAENGRPMPTVGVVPPTTIAATEEEAWAGTSVEGLLKWANDRGKWWVKPESGKFETAEDIEGSLIAGTPDQVVEQTSKFEEIGVQHLVFDLRLSFDRWHESIKLLGDEVLPALK